MLWKVSVAFSKKIWQPFTLGEISADLVPFTIANGLTLEGIDLLWADEEFKRNHMDLRIIHKANPDDKETGISAVREA
jgi:hypothetical protein